MSLLAVGQPPVRSDGRHKVQKLTNDELFYDPQLDEEDERWVQRQRLSYHNGSWFLITPSLSDLSLFLLSLSDSVRLSEELQRHKKTSSNPKPAAASDVKGFPLTDQVPCSDAVLSCPACMTVLCRDCQR